MASVAKVIMLCTVMGLFCEAVRAQSFDPGEIQEDVTSEPVRARKVRETGEQLLDSPNDPRLRNNHKKTRGTEPGTYLTTVIPYHPNQGLPSIEQLQIYIKILNAINEDSAAVPGLLTDYILKVLCPTS